MKSVLVLLMSFIFFAACASVSSQNEKVRVTSKPDMIAECEYIGPVGSSSMLVNIRAGGVTFNNAMHELKSEAKKKGANVVLISERSDTNAEAYKCN